MGGLPRRNTVVEAERAKGPVFVVDGGSLYWKQPSIDQALLPQQREKARLIARAYKDAGIDAMLPAAADLALGMDFVRGLAAEFELPYVATNLECDGGPPFARVLQSERGGVRWAVVGLVDDALRVPGCRVVDPASVLASTVAGVQADLVLLLADRPSQEVDRLLDPPIGVDLVIGTERRTLDRPLPAPGGALRLGAGSRGKQVGVLKMELVEGAERWSDPDAAGRIASQKDRYAERLQIEKNKLAQTTDEAARARAQRQVEFLTGKVADLEAELAAATTAAPGPANRAENRLVGLDDKVKDHPATAALLAEAKPRINAAAPTATVAVDGPFVGSAACLGCHATETAQWAGTAHARAWASLVNVQREGDAQCFACHATGAFHPAGPRTPTAVGAALADVGCESCHGPGRGHVERPEDVRMVKTPAAEVCTTCHDGKQDEGRFVLETYFPKVIHR